MNDKESGQFSIVRAIKATISGSWDGAEFEKEASDAVSKQIGRDASSFFVPLDVMQTRNNLEKLTNIAGGYLVSNDYMTSSFIEMLRNKMMINHLSKNLKFSCHQFP